MKIKILTLFIFLTFITVAAQYNKFGQDIFGENESNFCGASISMNDQGNIIAIFSAFIDGDSSGRVRVFEFSDDSWDLIGNPILGLPSSDGQGAGTVKLNAQGNRFIFGSPLNSGNGIDGAGTTRVFELQNNQWEQIGQDLCGFDANDIFGNSVDINALGDIIIIGASNGGRMFSTKGYVKTYILQDNMWNQLHQQLNGIQNGSDFGSAVSISALGSRIVILAEGDFTNNTINGYVQAFDLQDNSWVQIGDIILGETIEDLLGTVTIGSNPIDITNDGQIIAFGGKRSNDDVGYVKVMELQGNNWISRGDTIIENISNTSFGTSVSINDNADIIAVGAPFDGDSSEGFVSIYDYSNEIWQKSIPNIIGAAPSDFFGFSTSINSTGKTLIAGAPLSDANGNASGLVRSYGEEPLLSINTLSINKKIQLYPNPNNGSFKINFQNIIPNIDLIILNTLGQKIYSNSYQNKNEINIGRAFKSGLYVVKINYNGTYQSVKLHIR